jgi:pimeloyl-ACP methyl ester carboxylesterase
MDQPSTSSDRLYLLANQFRSYLGNTRVKEVTLDQEQWTYLEAGDASKPDTVLLLHGLAMSKQTWRSLFPILSQNHRLIAPDIHGLNINLPSQSHHQGIKALTDSILQLIEQLDLKNIHLVGHSLGSTLALNIALQCPERVKSLTMVSISDLNFTASMDSEIAMQGFQAFIESMDYSLYQQYVSSLFFQEPPGMGSFIRRTWRDFDRNREQIICMLKALEMELHNIQSQANQLKCPVMVLTGTQDQVGEQARLFTRTMIPEARWEHVNFCGHVPFLEQPKRFCSLLQHFLTQQQLQTVHPSASQ